MSYEIKIDGEKNVGVLRQPHLIKNLKTRFGKIVKKKIYQTPGTPNQDMVRPKKESDKMNIEDQKMFRSGVGMLLFLVKHSRPDIANGVKELFKLMDGTTLAGMKEKKE